MPSFDFLWLVFEVLIWFLKKLEYRIPMTTLRELTMLQLMNTITDKPDWARKVCLFSFLIWLLDKWSFVYGC